jgi:CelD/BcsL family acetyltransferase involved in cellulose biosynthesis
LPGGNLVLDVDIVHSEEGLVRLAPEWCSLEGEVPNALPFQSYAWNRAWWKAYANNHKFREDRLNIVVIREAHDLVGIIPLMESTFHILGARIFRYVRPLGASLGEIRTFLALPGFEDVVLSKWLELAVAYSFRPALHEITAQRESLISLGNRTTALRLLRKHEIPFYVIEPGSSWETYRSNRKRNIKQSLRHCYNSIARQGWRAELRVMSDPAQIILNLPDFYAMHSARANARTAVAHPDYFYTQANRGFLEDFICGFPGRTTKPFLFSLLIEGKPVAMRMGLLMDRELFMYCSGFDLKYARYSVMTTLVAEVIKWAISMSIPRINLSIGRDVSKTRWGPSEKIYAQGHFVTNSLVERSQAQLVLAIRAMLPEKQTADLINPSNIA